ncbi:MAG: oligosaccharide flippase family protein [Saprospiraceae bacterium]
MRSFVRGVNWTVLQQVANIGVNYASLILLARFLSPADFGLVALSTVLTGLFETLNGFGLPQLIVRERVTDRVRIGFYLALSLGLSALLAFLCILIAQLYAWQYGGVYRSDLLAVITVSSGALLLSSVVAIYQAQHQRDLDFRRPAIISMLSLLAGNALAVWQAAQWGDYWALVTRNVAPQFFLMCGFVFFSTYRPAFRLRQRLPLEERHFAFWLSGNQIVNYLSRNLDYLVIGRFFDIGIVGQYSIAYRLMLAPMKLLSSRVQAVLYPTLARMRDNPERILSFYEKTVSYISFAVFPLMGLAGVAAPLWAPWILDTGRYDAMVPLIQWLTVAGAFQAVTSPIGSLYLVFGMVRLMTAYSTASALVFLAGYGLGAWSGDIVIFAIIYTFLSVAINYFASNYVPLTRLGYPFGRFVRQTLEPALPAVVAYALLWAWLTRLAPRMPAAHPALATALATAAYAGLYFAAYAGCFGAALRDKIKQLKTLVS